MKPNRFRLTLEALEDRLAPAGNVQAVLAGGSLTLIGDAQDNAIALTQTAPRSFTITSIDGTTTINGAADPLTVNGVSRDLRVRLAGGNDDLRIGEFFGGEPTAVGRDLIIDLGAGHNTLDSFASLSVAGSLSVTAGDGNDRVGLRGVLDVGGDLTVRPGGGDNSTAVTPDFGLNTVGGDLRITAGAGSQFNDVSDTNVGRDVAFVSRGGDPAVGGSVTNFFGAFLSFEQLTVGGDVTFVTFSGPSSNSLTDTDVGGDVLISTGFDGQASVTVGPSLIEGAVTVGGGVSVLAPGDAQVALGDSRFGAEGGLDVGRDLHVLTGAGDDELSLAEVRVGRSTRILTDGGADAVAIDDALFRGGFTLLTGGGADTVRVESQLTLALEGVTKFRDRVLVDLGAGDDSLQFGVAGDPARLVRLSGPARFDGGPGSDLRDDANLDRGGQPVTFAGFERAAPPPLFLGPNRFAVGNYVIDVVSGDFNGDGKLDLAAANNDDRTVSVLLGNGDGTFAPAATLSAGRSPYGLAVADFNLDGKADLAVTNNFGPNGTVSVFLGNGDGTFAARLVSPVGSGVAPVDLAVGFFDADAAPDLAVIDRTGQAAARVSVLLGNGDGTFAAPAVIDLGSVGDGSAVAVGDVDGDGRADVVATTLRGFAFLHGNGDGTFAAPLFSAQPPLTSVVLADFNRDGRLDLVLAGNDTRVLLGNGDGTFGAATVLVNAGTVGVTVGDFDHDGILDVAAVHFGPSNGGEAGSVFFGNGDGTFRGPASFSPGLDGGPVVAGDFNRDGFDDLAAGNQEFASVSILLNSRRVS